jgi:hypothetical protein
MKQERKMYLDETFKGRIRIEGKLDDLYGYRLTVHDIDTGEQILNVCGISIFLCPGELNRADLTYHKYDEKGSIRVQPDRVFEPVIGNIHIDNPEIALSCYERCNDEA